MMEHQQITANGIHYGIPVGGSPERLYVVMVFDPEDSWVDQFYPGKADYEHATPILVLVETIQPEIDFSLTTTVE